MRKGEGGKIKKEREEKGRKKKWKERMDRRKETGLREKVEGGEWKGRRWKTVAEKCKMVSLNFIHHVSRSAILHAEQRVAAPLLYEHCLAASTACTSDLSWTVVDWTLGVLNRTVVSDSTDVRPTSLAVYCLSFTSVYSATVGASRGSVYDS